MTSLSAPVQGKFGQRLNSKSMTDDQKNPKVFEFEIQIRPLVPKLYGLARNHIGSSYPNQIEDLVFETLEKAFRSWHTYEQGTNLYGWLKVIMKNTALNLQIKESRMKAFGSYDALEDWQRDQNPVSLTTRVTGSAEAEAIESLSVDEITKALDALDEKRRAVIDSVIVQGYTYEETAKRLDMKLGTVMSTLHRSKEVLRKSLREVAIAEGIDVTPKKGKKKS